MHFLYSAAESAWEARRCARRVRELESACTRMTARAGTAPGGGTCAHEDAWIALAEAREEAHARMRAALTRYREVELFLDKLPTREVRAVMRRRYLEGLSWTEVGRACARDGVYYAERQIYRLHAQGVREARSLWEMGAVT